MTPNNKIVLALTLAVATAAAIRPAGAQQTTAPTIKAKPLRTKAAAPAKARFEVLNMTVTAIQVRSLTNPAEIHTFAYSEQLRDPMLALLDRGGYQYGDQVEIEYDPKTQTALKIKGKPSRPI